MEAKLGLIRIAEALPTWENIGRMKFLPMICSSSIETKEIYQCSSDFRKNQSCGDSF
jgi:hypothetical protein